MENSKTLKEAAKLLANASVKAQAIAQLIPAGQQPDKYTHWEVVEALEQDVHNKVMIKHMGAGTYIKAKVKVLGKKTIPADSDATKAEGQRLMTPGMVVRLKCHHTGKNLKLKQQDSADPTGISSDGLSGNFAKWIVHEVQGNAKAIRLQNFKHKYRWLRIMDDGTANAAGSGGAWTHFIPQYRGDGKVSLAWAHNEKWHVGFKNNGDLKEASKTGEGICGWFYFSEVNESQPVATSAPEIRRTSDCPPISPVSTYGGDNLVTDPVEKLKATDRAEGCYVAKGKPARAAENLRTCGQAFYYFEGTKGWAEYDFEKPIGADKIFVCLKLTTDKPRPMKISVDNKAAGIFFEEVDTGSFGEDGLQWVSAGLLNCPGGRDTVKLRLDPTGFAPHIAAVAVMPVETRQDSTLQKLKATDRAEGCEVRLGKPDRAAGNLEVRQEYYYFEGTKGWAEYDFEKPTRADNVFVFVKLTTDKPRPVHMMVDGSGAKICFKKADTGSFGPEGLRWYSAGMFKCPGGKDTFKLRLDPTGFAPHIAAVAVMPVETMQYSTLQKLKATDRAEGCEIRRGKPTRAAGNMEVRQEYYYFEGTKGWAEYDVTKPTEVDDISVFVKLTTDKPRPVKISVDGVDSALCFKDADTGSFGPEGLKWFSAGLLRCPGGRDTVKLRLDPTGFAPHIAAVAVMPVRFSISRPIEPPQAVKVPHYDNADDDRYVFVKVYKPVKSVIAGGKAPQVIDVIAPRKADDKLADATWLGIE